MFFPIMPIYVAASGNILVSVLLSVSEKAKRQKGKKAKRQKVKRAKRQKSKKAKIQKYKNTKRQKREFNIVMSGQFRTETNTRRKTEMLR